jgi:glycosyltransferase involved in cell wall biosynthesis
MAILPSGYHDLVSIPSISVLLPVRDAAQTLGACLKSLARQTVSDYEVVAVDDGSRDGSGEVLDRWAARDARYRVIHIRASGLVGALNIGLERCRAPVVARLDSDDICHPRRLTNQRRLLEEAPSVGVASCLVEIVPRSRVAGGYRRYEGWLNSLIDHESMSKERFVESPVAHPSVMFRRELVLGVGGYRDCGWPEDYDLWLRLMRRGVRFAKAGGRALYFWRDRPDRLSRSHPRYSKDAFLLCKVHHLLRGPLAGVGRVILWGAGRTGRRLGRILSEEGAKIAAWVDIDPAKVGRILLGAPIVAAEELPPFLEPEVPVLAAVAALGARDLIRSRLNALGLVEGVQYWCVA